MLANDNAQFAALLHEKKIAHEYRQLPGNHNWQYWDQQVREVLKIAAEKLRAQRSGAQNLRMERSFVPSVPM